MENESAKFDGWAIVEVLGRQRYAGYVTTESYGQAVLFRVEVPELPERETVLKSGRYGDDGAYLPAGAKVKEGKVQGYTKLVGSGSIHSMTPCTQGAALAAVESMQSQPLTLIELPPKAIAAPSDMYDDSDDDAFGSTR